MLHSVTQGKCKSHVASSYEESIMAEDFRLEFGILRQKYLNVSHILILFWSLKLYIRESLTLKFLTFSHFEEACLRESLPTSKMAV